MNTKPRLEFDGHALFGQTGLIEDFVFGFVIEGVIYQSVQQPSL